MLFRRKLSFVDKKVGFGELSKDDIQKIMDSAIPGKK